MPKTKTRWQTCEPGIGSVIDDFRVVTWGWLGRKQVPVDATIAFDGLCLILKGRGTFRLDDGPIHEVVAPCFFHIWPGPRFRYGPVPGSFWEERYLCVDGPRVDKWRIWGWLRHACAPCRLKNASTCVKLHTHLGEAFEKPGSHSIDDAKLGVERMLLLLKSNDARSRPLDPLGQMLESWRDASKRPTSLHEAAASLRMSYSSFRAKVAARKGMGPHQYLLHMSIDEASRLLIGTDESIKAIAYATGFHSAESFCRAFRRLRGMTATRHRTIHRVQTKS
jgi:AraC family transcriptional regulator, arabinose operon regulatory protein